MNNTTNTFRSWNSDEDTSLQACYISGEAIVQIADAHQRTIAEIKARLIQLRTMPNFYSSTPFVQVYSSSKAKDSERFSSRLTNENEHFKTTVPPAGKKDVPDNAGKKWNAEQERMLADNFNAGMSIPALAQLYERTAGSIATRLFRLGLIDDPFAYSDAKSIKPTVTPQVTALKTVESEFPF